MTDIQVPTPGLKLQRQYGLEGRPPVPTLAPEIIPVAIVDNLATTGSAQQAIDAPRTAMGRVTQGSGANKGVNGLFVPAGSNIIVTVLRVLLYQPAVWGSAQRIFQKFGDASAGIAMTGVADWRDRRLSGGPAATLGHKNAAASADLVIGDYLMPNLGSADNSPVPLVIEGPWVLTGAPGATADQRIMYFETETNAVFLASTWFWTEETLVGFR